MLDTKGRIPVRGRKKKNKIIITIKSRATAYTCVRTYYHHVPDIMVSDDRDCITMMMMMMMMMIWEGRNPSRDKSMHHPDPPLLTQRP